MKEQLIDLLLKSYGCIRVFELLGQLNIRKSTSRSSKKLSKYNSISQNLSVRSPISLTYTKQNACNELITEGEVLEIGRAQQRGQHLLATRCASKDHYIHCTMKFSFSNLNRNATLFGVICALLEREGV